MAQKQLFTFTREDVIGNVAGNARSATSRRSAAPYIKPLNLAGTEIDIVKDFSWTETPSENRLEVPVINLREYYVNFNVLLNQIRYYLSSLGDTKDALADLSKDLTNSGLLENDNVRNSTLGGINLVNGLIPDVNQSSIGLDGANKVNRYLNPYYGLYSVTTSGFRYKFPYFTPDNRSISTSWGELNTLDKGVLGSTLGDAVSKFLKGTAGAVGKIFQTGTYIEQSKAYSYDQNPTSKTFEFYLHNTTTIEDVIKNWHLIFMLVYQNLPNKSSKVLLEPPVIYEVEIPGLYYTPFGYITKLNIENIGGIRETTIDIAIDEGVAASIEPISNNQNDTLDLSSRADQIKIRQGAKSNFQQTGINEVRAARQTSQTGNNIRVVPFKTIIPDSYKVSIEVVSLIPDTRNLLFHTIWNNNQYSKNIYNVVNSNNVNVQIDQFEPESTAQTRDASLNYERGTVRNPQIGGVQGGQAEI